MNNAANDAVGSRNGVNHHHFSVSLNVLCNIDFAKLSGNDNIQWDKSHEDEEKRNKAVAKNLANIVFSDIVIQRLIKIFGNMVVVEVREQSVKDEKHHNLNAENLVHLLFKAGRLVRILTLIHHNFSVSASSNNDTLHSTVFYFSSARQEVLHTNDLVVTRRSSSRS